LHVAHAARYVRADRAGRREGSGDGDRVDGVDGGEPGPYDSAVAGERDAGAGGGSRGCTGSGTRRARRTVSAMLTRRTALGAAGAALGAAAGRAQTGKVLYENKFASET